MGNGNRCTFNKNTVVGEKQCTRRGVYMPQLLIRARPDQEHPGTAQSEDMRLCQEHADLAMSIGPEAILNDNDWAEIERTLSKVWDAPPVREHTTMEMVLIGVSAGTAQA